MHSYCFPTLLSLNNKSDWNATCCPCSCAWSSIFFSLSFIFSCTLLCWSDWLSRSSNRVTVRWSRSLSSSFCLRSCPFSFLRHNKNTRNYNISRIFWQKQSLQKSLILVVLRFCFKLNIKKNIFPICTWNFKLRIPFYPIIFFIIFKFKSRKRNHLNLITYM